MEYLYLAAALVLMIVVFMAKEYWDSLNYRKNTLSVLYKQYGQLPERDYRDGELSHIKNYYLKHSSEGQIDDITWNDLNMDYIYKHINSCVSGAGDEYLYYRLRTPYYDKEQLDSFEELINFFQKHQNEREAIQKYLYLLGRSGKHSIYEYIENLNILGNRSSKKYFIWDLLFIASIAVMFVSVPIGVVCVLIVACHNIIDYFKEYKEIEPYVTSFSYVRRMLLSSANMLKVDIPVKESHMEELSTCYKRMHVFLQGSSFISSGLSLGGDPLSVVRDYLKMLFYLDLILFNRSYYELKSKLTEIDNMITIIGKLETAIVIGSYRENLGTNWCVPTFDTNSGNSSFPALKIVSCYHPLLTDPIPNTIFTDKCVLLTGSNASGKSTFLRAVALNVLLAQTLHTCLATEYNAPIYHLYSSMSLKDDISMGNSYYMAEIKSIKRIMDQAQYYKNHGEHVICFVDEVLRGTNTVERIAASTQILKMFADIHALCFAATHDIELTELLKQKYSNYHFKEIIEQDDIHFPYKLLEGPATTRNAIALLKMLHYNEKITDDADKMADYFLHTGKWQ